VLVVRFTLGMMVPVDQAFREPQPFPVVVVGASSVIVMPKGTRSVPKQLRRRAKGKDKEEDGEPPA